jgi:hypothetical protein
LNTVLSPEEMMVDPIFDYGSQRKDVSNIHDLPGWTGLYNCERVQSINISTTDRTERATVGSIGVINTSATINRFFTPQVKPVIEPVVQPVPLASKTNSSNLTKNQSYFWTIIAAGAVEGILVLMVGGLVFAGVTLIRQNKS